MNKIITAVISALLAVAIADAAPATPRGKDTGVRHESARPLASIQGNSASGKDTRHIFGTLPPRKFSNKALKIRNLATGGIATPADLCGSVTYNTEFNRGIQIIPQTPEGEFVMIAPDIVANRGAVMVDGIYYVARSEGYLDYTYYIDTYDATNWELIESRETSIELMSADMALDPVSGKVYGCFFASLDNISGKETYAFGTADFETLTMTPICSLEDKFWSAMAFDNDGTLYAIDMEGKLLVINKETGETVREVGSTGLTPFYTSSGIIEPKTGRFFYTFANYYNGSLYEIDKATGASTLLVDFPNQDNITGLFFPPAPAADNAPAQPTGLSTDFNGASLLGNVVFTVPSLTYGGSQIEGDIQYSVIVNKESLANGTARAGETVSAQVKLPQAGEYEFIVVLSNDAGEGPKSKAKAYVGNDTPLSPEIISFERVGGSFNLSWKPVDAGVHGGYVDAASVTYKVIRMPDNITVEEATAATSVSDPVAQPDNLTAYSYTVTASAAGLASEPASTDVIALGEIHPPYFPTFLDENPLQLYTLIDANNDGQVWEIFKWNETTAVLRLKYNSSEDLDDWVITPPIAMEEGKSYKVAFNTYAQEASYPEKLEVKWGNAPTVESMANTLMPPTEITALKKEPLHVEEYITPAESGTYYIGFHGISGVYTYYLYVSDFEISAGMGQGDIAAAVTQFNVAPDPAGELKAVVSMSAPAVDTGGNPLEAVKKVELYRDLELVHTFTDVTPGKPLEHTDNVGVKGVHTWRAIPYTEAGAGIASEDISRYIGINIPGKVENLAGVETDGDGMVTVSWNPPSVDIEGNLIMPGIITYTLCDISDPDNPVVLLENTKETTHSYRALEAGSRQTLAQWQVTAHTEAGSGIDAKSVFVPVGVPYETPFRESFSGGNVSSVAYANNIAGRGMWDLLNDSYGIKSQDGDYGYAGMTGVQSGDAAALGLGKVTIPQENPGIWFYAYNINTGTDNENTVKVEANTGTGWEEVATIVMKDLPVVSAWNRVTLKLDKYAGKGPHFRFIATTRTYSNTLIDNVNIGSLSETDLAAEHISVPDKAAAGTQFPIRVTIGNYGASGTEDYTVKLFRDGNEIATANGVAVASGMRATVGFNDTLNAMSGKSSEYYAEVQSEADDNASNNISPKATVVLDVPILPVIKDLSGECIDKKVTLTWGNPDMSTLLPDPATESFENAESFAINSVEGWSFIDADGAPTWKLSNKTFPNEGLEMAYIVFDDTHEFADEYLTANTGHKYLACMSAKVYEPEHNDDWLISPRLCGASQQISFFAKSYTTQYGYELVEVYYSLGGKEVDDFVKVGHTIEVPEGWTRYTVDLPEDALYFAIRCISADRCALMIDDITYIPDAELPDLGLKGYNIYRDGVKLNDSPVATKSYSDIISDGEPHRYGVTVVYDRGESAISNIIDVETSGLGNVLYDNASPQSGDVYDLRGIKVISNATPRQVSALPAGIYIHNGRKITVK